MRELFIYIIILSAFLGSPAMAKEPMTITCRTPESDTDKRYEYDNALLKLALEKTTDDWGAYRLVPSSTMNFARAINYLFLGTLENPMFKHSVEPRLSKNLTYVPFPVDLGIVGYRIFFTSTEIVYQVGRATTLDGLKKYSMGQGIGWTDVEILTAAGFKVVSPGGYNNLFKMVAVNRFDLFPRGANEVKEEYEAHSNLQNLAIAPNIGIYYPLPRFFYTNKQSTKAARRVYEGLLKAYEDGSLQKLWEQYYQPSIDFVDLKSRKFFTIPNPLLKDIDPSYEKFLYKPQ